VVISLGFLQLRFPPDSLLFTMPDRMKKPYSVSIHHPSTFTIPTNIVHHQRPIASNGSWLHDKAPTAPRAASLNNKLLVSNLHYEVTPKDLTVSIQTSSFFPKIFLCRLAQTRSSQSIFGQIGTLIREPQIRVRTSECTEFT
jgi:hypothetical protein